jgi:hypothetical protein
VGIGGSAAVTVDPEVRQQLLAVDGVLVWVDPIHEWQTRAVLDPMLLDVASRGPWVSALPDVILKMGTKEVLHRTKHLGWGTDTHLYRTVADFRGAFPPRLQAEARASSSRTGETRAKGSGASSRCPRQPVRPASCVCCMRAGEACPRRWRSATS